MNRRRNTFTKGDVVTSPCSKLKPLVKPSLFDSMISVRFFLGILRINAELASGIWPKVHTSFSPDEFWTNQPRPVGVAMRVPAPSKTIAGFHISFLSVDWLSG